MNNNVLPVQRLLVDFPSEEHRLAGGSGEPINRVPREHQETLNDWVFSGDIRELHGWVEEMVSSARRLLLE